jgi:hypothetical protein
MGILVNEYKITGECKCTAPLLTGKQLCWSPGIIGALSQEQIEKYCRKKIVKETEIPPVQTLLAEASRFCRIGNIVDGKQILDVKDRLNCIKEYIEKRKRGI